MTSRCFLVLNRRSFVHFASEPNIYRGQMLNVDRLTRHAGGEALHTRDVVGERSGGDSKRLEATGIAASPPGDMDQPFPPCFRILRLSLSYHRRFHLTRFASDRENAAEFTQLVVTPLTVIPSTEPSIFSPNLNSMAFVGFPLASDYRPANWLLRLSVA